MASLKALQLSGEKVANAAIDSITRLPKLNVLKLDATSVGNAGLEKRSAHPATRAKRTQGQTPGSS